MTRHLIFLAALTTSLTACASAPQPPMHVYNSAFLENEGVVEATPKTREFDPLELGDYPRDAAVYVVRDDGRWTGGMPSVSGDAVPDVDTTPKRVADERAPKVGKKAAEATRTPALSTTLGPAPTGTGGKQATDSSAKVETVDESNEGDQQGYAPSVATQLVRQTYGLNGVTMEATDPADVYKVCKAKERVYFGTKPKVGDIVFFHNTFDANSDGRNNDWYTHLGLVQAVSGDGTIDVVAWHEGRVTTHRLNLERPEVAEEGSTTLNSKLREPGNDDAPFTQYYSGQLFAGFCGLLGEKSEFVMVENWRPGMDLSPDDTNP